MTNQDMDVDGSRRIPSRKATLEGHLAGSVGDGAPAKEVALEGVLVVARTEPGVLDVLRGVETVDVAVPDLDLGAAHGRAAVGVQHAQHRA